MKQVIQHFIELKQCPFCAKDFEYRISDFTGNLFTLSVYDNFIEVQFTVNHKHSLPERLHEELCDSPMTIRIFSDEKITYDDRLKKYLQLYAVQFRIGKHCELYPFHQFRQSIEVLFNFDREPEVYPFYEQISFIEGDNYYFLGNGWESMANLAQSEIRVQNKHKGKVGHTTVDRIFFHKLNLSSVDNIISAFDAVSILA